MTTLGIATKLSLASNVAVLRCRDMTTCHLRKISSISRIHHVSGLNGWHASSLQFQQRAPIFSRNVIHGGCLRNITSKHLGCGFSRVHLLNVKQFSTSIGSDGKEGDSAQAKEKELDVQSTIGSSSVAEDELSHIEHIEDTTADGKSAALKVVGTGASDTEVYVLVFTCNKCNHRAAKRFTKHSYRRGVVIVRCDKCKNLHLVADNLGWFEDDNVNIEMIAKKKGIDIQYFLQDSGAVSIQPASDGQANTSSKQTDPPFLNP